MNQLFGGEPLLFPSLSAAVVYFVTAAYGVLLLATLVGMLPHARRYLLSEQWGGYAQRSALVTLIQNPVVMPAVLALWLAAAVALIVDSHAVIAAAVNFLLCRYFFIQMRWRGVLRGMGAPGFICYWLGAGVLLLEYTGHYAPELQGLALLVLQVDFALIMFSAGAYKYSAGYRSHNGMELGMVNPEWGYWWRFWGAKPPGAWYFHSFNTLAWATEVVAAALMLYPPTRLLGGMLILLSFIFIATQIRLGFLCEMVIVCCLLFAYPRSLVDVWVQTIVPTLPFASAPPPLPGANTWLAGLLWAYLVLLPVARAGLMYNFHAKRSLPDPLQRIFEIYTNLFGLIIWRVFSADVTNFFVRIYEQRPDGSRQLISRWANWRASLRYNQVAESITVTTLFTTLKYYPSNNALFVDRLLRYARTVPHDRESVLAFEYVSITKHPDRFGHLPAAEYVVDVKAGTVHEHILQTSISVHAAADASPIHEGARPGSYVPLRF
jgi:hypothetical protein